MSDINILTNGIVQGEEIPSEASQISYSGKVDASNVKDALDKLQTELANKPIIENLDKVCPCPSNVPTYILLSSSLL